MANTRDIRRRIKSVKNTAQITKAMQMVAATKMRRAQSRALAGRPYAERLERVASHLSEQVIGVSHPLLTPRPVRKRAVLVLATDRGLCGSLNTNLLREVANHDRPENVYVTIGRKARQFVPRLKASGGSAASGQGKANLLADFEIKDNFAFAETKTVAQFLIDKFLAGEIDAVDVAYNHFVNALTQKPVIVPLLPIGRLPDAPAEKPGAEHAIYLCEPPAEDLLHSFLPFAVHFQVYQYLLDARASEHSARMVAMKNATENAKSLVKDLTLEYNKARQASITTELLEITTAQLAIS